MMEARRGFVINPAPASAEPVGELGFEIISYLHKLFVETAQCDSGLPVHTEISAHEAFDPARAAKREMKRLILRRGPAPARPG